MADESRPDPQRVVILSAGVGAGHDGAARAWAERLVTAGFDVQIHDLLEVLRRRKRPWVAAVYEAVLLRAPWVYQLLFAVATRPFGVVIGRALMGGAMPKVAELLGLRRRGLAGLLRRGLPAEPIRPPVAVLCTYPLAGHVLGDLRRQDRLHAPVLTFLTDFSVHRLCVAPGVDAHLAVHRLSARQAEAYGGRPALVCGPVVGRRFERAGDTDPSDVGRLRDHFGLPYGVPLALLVAGSWGVGEVEATVAEIAATGVAVPVVVCGRNERLRARVSAARVGIAMGWITDMPALMRCVDVLVENAGGLSSLEAMAVGLPVATYRPIAGHGRTNAQVLDAAGVTRYIREPGDLAPALGDLIDGAQGGLQRDRARALFATDPVEVFRAAVRVDACRPVSERPGTPAVRTVPRLVAAGRPRPTAVRVGGWARPVVALALLFAIVTMAGNSSAEFAVAHGVRAVRPSHTAHTSYLVVRPGLNTELSGRTERLLLETSAAVAIDRPYATLHPQTVRALAAAGVPILITEPAHGPVFDEVHAIRADAAGIARLTGSRPTLFVPNRRIDAIDYGAAASVRVRVVQPRIWLDRDEPVELPGSQIVLIDGSRDPNPDLPAILTRIQFEAARSGVPLGSIAELADEPAH